MEDSLLPRSITLSYRRILLLSNTHECTITGTVNPKNTTNHMLIFPIKHRTSITYPGQLDPTFGQSGVAQPPPPPPRFSIGCLAYKMNRFLFLFLYLFFPFAVYA